MEKARPILVGIGTTLLATLGFGLLVGVMHGLPWILYAFPVAFAVSIVPGVLVGLGVDTLARRKRHRYLTVWTVGIGAGLSATYFANVVLGSTIWLLSGLGAGVNWVTVSFRPDASVLILSLFMVPVWCVATRLLWPSTDRSSPTSDGLPTPPGDGARH